MLRFDIVCEEGIDVINNVNWIISLVCFLNATIRQDRWFALLGLALGYGGMLGLEAAWAYEVWLKLL